MADIVHKVNGIDIPVEALAASIDSVRGLAARHSWSIGSIGERLMKFFVPVDDAIRASEQYSLLPPDVRINEER